MPALTRCVLPDVFQLCHSCKSAIDNEDVHSCAKCGSIYHFECADNEAECPSCRKLSDEFHTPGVHSVLFESYIVAAQKPRYARLLLMLALVILFAFIVNKATAPQPVTFSHTASSSHG